MNIQVGAQIFDLAFHPTHSTVYTALLTGEVIAFKYSEQGQHEKTLCLRPSKRSCRTLTIDEDGKQLWAAGKAKALLYVPFSF
jgi:WD repeat-containing protein 55